LFLTCLYLTAFRASQRCFYFVFTLQVTWTHFEWFEYSLFRFSIVSSPFYRWEFKVNHEEWLTSVKPDLAPALAARTKAALETNSHSLPLVERIKDEARYAINDLLKVNVKLQ